MSIKDILASWRDGDSYREHVAEHCYIEPLSRYKIIGKTVHGLYGKLIDEAFVLKLTLKSDNKDFDNVFVGNYAGPKLLELARKEIPPCFNPLRTEHEHGDIPLAGGRYGAEKRPYTAYNLELYTIINLFFIVLRMDHTRKDTPISRCLYKLREYGGDDLTPYWAWKMNDVMGKYKSSVEGINTSLLGLDERARAFAFPQIRQRLEKDDRLRPEDVLF